ncbi:hypothetical protein T552_01780 [Pneumocystis carinii B80]|uniref:Golgi to ER traffic protein 2 n=1 Tax=Pneumocystis carinii (strain B80) TaxID=1408658 RepID=A0A0W4ZJH5_PNEC8|nr:hypothetical protein T552_01780 [Pneumocystis carinii B80]KTW28521.1 hypothetical protein T552_01780 [Pneumocystis carinii B80]
MDNEVLDESEKARLRRKVRKERILGHESERLSKIARVLYPESSFEEKKTLNLSEISSKTKESNETNSFAFEALNDQRKSTYPTENSSFGLDSQESLDFLNEKNNLFENYQDKIISNSISFLKDIFFNEASTAQSREPDPLVYPITSSSSEKWRQWIHFVSTMALLLKVVLGHTKFLGTNQDRLTYSMEQPIFYYFMMIQWILHSIWLLLQTTYSHPTNWFFLDPYLSPSLKSYLTILSRFYLVYKTCIRDICLIVFVLGSVAAWNQLFSHS